jgi:hypothetical protein
MFIDKEETDSRVERNRISAGSMTALQQAQ